MKEKGNCLGCKFFLQYYVKYKRSYMQTSVGHCICVEMSKQARKKQYMKGGCSYWESEEEIKEIRKQSILRDLSEMNERLAEITFLLRDDAKTEE